MADNVSITEGSGKTIAGDEITSAIYQRIKLIHGADGTNDGDVSSANPFPVTVNRVTSLVDGTVTVSSITGITNTVGVYFQGSSPAVSVEAKYGATKVPLLGNTDGAIKVYDIVTGTIGTVTNITNSIGAHILSTNGTIAVNIGTLTNTAAIMAKDGTFAVYYSPSRPIVLADQESTVSIFTVSGSTSGGTTSGVTLVAPSANYNFKVFAYSLQTTAIASTVWKFTNGAGSETELWRPLVTAAATTSAPVGANLAVKPPGHIFATGTNTTLALKSDTGSLVHYSVSYRKEAA